MPSRIVSHPFDMMYPMLTTTAANEVIGLTPDDCEQELMHLETLIGRLRARQVEILREVDRMQVPLADGARSFKEWIAGRLDVHPTTASDLSFLARAASRGDSVGDGYSSLIGLRPPHDCEPLEPTTTHWTVQPA